MIFLRSTAFFVLGTLNTIFYGLFTVPLSIFWHDVGYECARGWGWRILWLAKHVCGIDYQVRGLENIPARPVVVMAKHQSAWETVGILCHLPRAVWIIKKELVWVPIIGWVLGGLKSIAIDRKSGRSARDQILEQGKDRLGRGYWVMIFPEGTRVAPGERGRYGLGGSLLAVGAEVDVLPIAHNAGECWRRNAFLKYPGTVTMSIGAPISTRGKTAVEVGREVEEWIEAEMLRLPPTSAANNAYAKRSAGV
ncbi:MAG: 1-acyl-sn-glycerol-3-phosphate acyltransferase [Rhodocyclaceae bacterium]|nr:1-acyl-sn-glycerol-3-phosphate acyltransferase [Rhodocyclaceae bacterium]MCA3082819.1 1-acyl-sn-glycerol-3-phosphate acyltransferase [Rhodocyclaceae bacterium]